MPTKSAKQTIVRIDFTKKRVTEKRKVLDAWAVELGRIVGLRPEIEQLALAA
jgi:hypothetical protein